jgi:hypothetical protein
MQLKETRAILQEFGKYVVQQSRSILTRKKKNLSSTLYKSLEYDVIQYDEGIKLVFEMAHYGKFVDKGVSGKKRKFKTPFSYKNKKPPMKNLMNWAKARKFRFRDEKGRYTKGTYKTIGFVLQNFIFREGIKPTLFFTKPYNEAFNKFDKKIVQAFLNDIEV